MPAGWVGHRLTRCKRAVQARATPVQPAHSIAQRVARARRWFPQIVHDELNEKEWEEDKVAGWMTSITEKSTEALADLGKPFKYLGEVTSVDSTEASARGGVGPCFRASTAAAGDPGSKLRS